ncbi:MAG: VWA domain-containing protein [Acidimicrobiia bacterium]|nr:VWA domain-containing protein [Acidimicrobiia bacterium]
MKRRTAALLAMGMLLAASPAAGAEEAVEPRVLLIMDASGSMGRVDANGIRLIDGAKEALTTLVDALPEGIPIGLRVYGHRTPNTDKATGCQDTELVVPVGPLDRAQMKQAIESFDSQGFTPIGLSLQEAVQDLGGSGTVVLVSDGEDTCAPPDPCEIAIDLIEEGYEMRVETVGFFLEDDPARDQLRCIAESTGGSFREVGSLGPLVAELGAIVREAVPDAGSFHLPVRGSTEPATGISLPLSEDRGVTSEWLEYSGFFESRISAGETVWFTVDVEEGRGLGVHGAHISDLEWLPGETLEILILGPGLEDARRVAPRRGADIVDLTVVGELLAAGHIQLGAFTATDFLAYGELEPEERETLYAQGIDESSYNDLWHGIALGPREAPNPAGTYHIGLAWHSERADAEITLGWGAWITRYPAELYGRVYVPRDGALSRSSAVELTPTRDSQPFDLYGLPPGEYPMHRWFYSGELRAGETRWYHQPLEFDEALAVEATLLRDEAPTTDSGTFGVAIYDEAGELLGGPYVSEPTVTVSAASATAGASMAYTGEGEVPFAITGGAWLAVTWNTPIEETAEVRLVVDVLPRFDGVTPVFAPPEPGASEQPVQPPAVASPDDSGSVIGLVAGAVAGVLLLGTGAVWWRKAAARRP